jgi:endonuclease/exonuclease/phosphatase family metal-dependent hydrolase
MQCRDRLEFTATPLNGETAATFRAGSYNILYEAGGESPTDSLSWVNRKWRLFNVMDECNFDIVGTQEQLGNQPADICTKYPHFARYDRIYYRHARFRRLDGGRFWLSETPDRQSGSWETDRDCFCDWLKLLDKPSGIVFYYYNIHFDAFSAVARNESAKLMARRLKAHAGTTPLFISGDFNSTPDTPATATMRSAFSDVFDLAETVNRGIGNRTYNNLKTTPGQNSTWIDYIYVNAGDNRRFTVHSAAVNDKVFETKVSIWVIGTQFASDHFPIVSEVTLK